MSKKLRALHRKVCGQEAKAAEVSTWTPFPGPQAQAYNIATQVDELFYGGAGGAGKALCVDTPIPTPTGWKMMGELREGDEVLTEHGLPTKVARAFDVIERPVSYRLTFDNGEVIDACNHHLWLTTTTIGDATAKTTQTIFTTLVVDQDKKISNHAIPLFGRSESQFRYIVCIESIPSKPMRCIAVDNPTHLFLCGRSFIPTHNSALVIGLALTKFRSSLILRRQATQLRELVSQLHEAAPKGSKWRGIGSGGIMRTPDGRIIELAGVPHEEDKRKFQGRPHTLLAFDEVCDFSETICNFITLWLRSTKEKHSLQMMTGNPPTSSSGEWVIRRFRDWVDPSAGDKAQPGEVRYYATLDGKEERFPDATPFVWRGYEIRPMSRTFIPGKLKDNPALRDTNYASRLANMPHELREALLFGDFTIALRDDAWQVIPSSWIRAARERWTAQGFMNVPMSSAGLDIAYGGTDRTVFVAKHANWVAPFHTWRDKETDSGEKAANLVAPLVLNKNVVINADGIGYGASACEFLKKMNPKTTAIGFGESANGLTDERKVLSFNNIRSYAMWKMREQFDPELSHQIAIPPDDELQAELASMRWKYEGGKVRVEKKEEIKERLGRSPDKADALALACFEMPKRTAFIGVF